MVSGSEALGAARICEEIFETAQSPVAKFKSDLTKSASRFRLGRDWVKTPTEYGEKREGVRDRMMGTGTGYIESNPEEFRSAIRLTFERTTDHESPEVLAPVIPSHYPAPEVVGARLKTSEGVFRLSNIGSRSLYQATQAITERIDHLSETAPEGSAYLLPIDKRWVDYQSKIENLQSLSSQKTVLGYKTDKPYLLDEDLSQLQFDDFFKHARSEYLVLTREIGKAPYEMTREEFDSNLVLAMRLARSGLSTTFWDTDALDHRFPGWLPCLARLAGKPKQALQTFFASLEKQGLRIAEMSRFRRFQKFPPDVVPFLILQMFEFSHHPTDPVDVFVLEVDPLTRRLFSKYGIEELAKLPAEDGEAPEYIMAIDTRTQGFKDMVREMRAEFDHYKLEHQPAPESAPHVEPIRVNPLDGIRLTGVTNLTKEKADRDQFRQLRKKLAQDTRRMSASGAFVKTRAEIAAVVQEAMKAPLNEVISPGERQRLFKQINRFSDDYESTVLLLARFLPSRGRVAVVNAGAESYFDFIPNLLPELQIQNVSLKALEESPAASLDGVVMLDAFHDASEMKRNSLYESARRTLKRKRQLLTLDPAASRLRAEGPVTRVQIARALDSFATSAIRNGALATRADLLKSLVIARQFLASSAQSQLTGRTLVDEASERGFADHFNFGFQMGWLMSGEFSWIEKE